MREVPGNVLIEELKELSFNLGKVRVQACFANHPGTCVGYRLFTSGGSICFFPDNEPHYGYGHPLETASRDGTALEYAKEQERQMIEFLRGSDVLIMDAQYDREEYRQHLGWGHGCLDHVVGLALRGEVKRLFLFHHDPAHDDAFLDRLLASMLAAKSPPFAVLAAQEGATFELSSA